MMHSELRTQNSELRTPTPNTQNPTPGTRGTMAHHVAKSGYAELVDRLNRFPQGAPPSDLLFAILKMLFSEREAELVSLLPVRPFTAETAARLWKMPPAEAQKALD